MKVQGLTSITLSPGLVLGSLWWEVLQNLTIPRLRG